MIDKTTDTLDNGDYATGIFPDFSKAFDAVHHWILLCRLSHYGIRGIALDWFKSYQSNRSQFLTYNTELHQLQNQSTVVFPKDPWSIALFYLYQ